MLSAKFRLPLLLCFLIPACAAEAPPPKAPAPRPTVAAPPPPPPAPMTREETGRALLAKIVAGDYTGATATFHPAIQQEVTPIALTNALRTGWSQIVGAAGPFQKVVDSRIEQKQGRELLILVCAFEKGPMEIKIGFAETGEPVSFVFAPPYIPPSYANPAAFSERAITVGSAELPLPGTLTMPKGTGPFPAVVLIPGSGPQDQDASLGPNRPFKDIAWGLASRGIAVLRFEKRTYAHGKKLVADMSMTTKEEVVDDAVSAIALLGKTQGIDPARVFLAGHSYGGALAPRIAAAAPTLAGIIVLSGPARPLADVILEQFTYVIDVDGIRTDEEKAELANLTKQVARTKDKSLTKETSSDELPYHAPAAYWLDVRGYKPADEVKKVKLPVLLLQGERDYQVTKADFDQWKRALAGRKNAKLAMLPGLNHLLVRGEGKIAPIEYLHLGKVDQIPVDEMAAFIAPPAH